jgi:ornithine cyclodeaminase
MVPVYSRADLEGLIQPREAIAAMRDAFLAYSSGQAVVPPVGQLDFEEPPGDCHIKYGYMKHHPTFTVKIATGFWRNPERGLPSGNGVVLVFSSETGALATLLQDEGYLTDLRTAAAGALAAQLLAPRRIECIGTLGAGAQARLQLELLREVTDCRRVRLWARAPERAHALAAALAQSWEVEVVPTPAAAALGSQLIVTTTAAREWLLSAQCVAPGTHITAVGADGGGKQELDPQLFARARVRAVDSRAQCAQYGDAAPALAAGYVRLEDLVELGELIAEPARGRSSDSDITIADLTGVAVQDMAIAELALAKLAARPRPPAQAKAQGRPT